MSDEMVKNRDFDTFAELSRKVTDGLVSIFDQFERNEVSVEHLYARVQGLYDASAGLLDEEAEDNLNSAMGAVHEAITSDHISIPFVAIDGDAMVSVSVKNHDVIVRGITAGKPFSRVIDCGCYLGAMSKARTIVNDRFKDWEWTN